MDTEKADKKCEKGSKLKNVIYNKNMRVTNKNKPLKPKSKLEGIKLINIKIDDSEVKKTKVSKSNSETINPMGSCYNKKEIRYDKIYPELPWNINKPLIEVKLPLRLYITPQKINVRFCQKKKLLDNA